MGDRYGFQFDAFAKAFRMTEGENDMPPLIHGFRLQPEHSNSLLTISFGSESYPGIMSDPAVTLLQHFEKRSIADDSAHVIGQDSWGYLNTGERWRQFRLSGAVARYSFVDKYDAELFDGILSSACFLTPPGS
jgi:hypothetical protein